MKKDNIKIVCDVSGIQFQLARIANEVERISHKIESGESADDRPDSTSVDVIDIIIQKVKESISCQDQE